MTRDDVPTSARPLQHSAPHALLKPRSTARFNGRVATPSWHLFVNQSESTVDLYWFYSTRQVKHGVIAPGSNLYVGTYPFHNWKIVSPTGATLGQYAGDSATVTVQSDGQLQVSRNAGHLHASPAGSSVPHIQRVDEKHPVHGLYRQRGEVLGMPIWAFDSVSEEAVLGVKHVAAMMLDCSPDWLKGRMLESGSVLAIVGRDQHVTDLPPHRFMKHLQGRDLDATSRGLGGTEAVPVTSVGEENVTMNGDPLYPYQSVLVHELGHAVLNLGLDRQWHQALCTAFEAARQQLLYPQGCYQMTNEQEYWAVGTEAWFESTIRTDVNGGFNSREKLKQHDPQLALLLSKAYGDGAWRYVHDCPAPLRMRTPDDGPAEQRLRRKRDKAAATLADLKSDDRSQKRRSSDGNRPSALM